LDVQCAIDSLRVPVMPFELVWCLLPVPIGMPITPPRVCSAKHITFYGYRLHLLTTLGGVILEFSLTSASSNEREAAASILYERWSLTVIGHKSYVSALLALELAQERLIQLIALPRANQHVQ